MNVNVTSSFKADLLRTRRWSLRCVILHSRTNFHTLCFTGSVSLLSLCLTSFLLLTMTVHSQSCAQRRVKPRQALWREAQRFKSTIITLQSSQIVTSAAVRTLKLLSCKWVGHHVVKDTHINKSISPPSPRLPLTSIHLNMAWKLISWLLKLARTSSQWTSLRVCTTLRVTKSHY